MNTGLRGDFFLYRFFFCFHRDLNMKSSGSLTWQICTLSAESRSVFFSVYIQVLKQTQVYFLGESGCDSQDGTILSSSTHAICRFPHFNILIHSFILELTYDITSSRCTLVGILLFALTHFFKTIDTLPRPRKRERDRYLDDHTSHRWSHSCSRCGRTLGTLKHRMLSSSL